MNVESRLKEMIGEPAGRLHTARSRNDQVATDMRLYVRDVVDALDAAVTDLMRALAEKAEAHHATVMPGFTHLQVAQPITFGHHCLAYVEMLSRDRGRLRDARARLNEIAARCRRAGRHALPHRPQGDGKGAGLLSADAELARCRVVARLCAGSARRLCHLRGQLSRMAEEIVLWTTAQFRFVKLTDKFTTALHHAAEAESGCRRTGAGQARPHPRRLHGACRGDEGPAAGLFQGHAGGQGTGLRCLRCPGAGARRHGGHGERPSPTRHRCGRRP